MFMRVSWGRVKAGEWERYEADFKEMALSEKRSGLVRRCLLRDIADSDSGFSISLWSSLETMKRYDEQRKQAGSDDKIAGYFTGDFRVAVCEVVVDATK